MISLLQVWQNTMLLVYSSDGIIYLHAGDSLFHWIPFSLYSSIVQK